MKKFHFRLWLLRWHRRFGIVLSIFLLWMITTGVLLNHEQLFALDKKTLDSDFWLSWYGVGHAEPLMVANKRLMLNQEGLWLEQQNLGDCSLLLGIVKQSQQTIIACRQHLWLLTSDGDVIDQVDSLRGLNQHFDALAFDQKGVFLRADSSIFRFHSDDLSVSLEPNAHPSLAWLEPVKPNVQITVERWLLDAHSGRLWGQWGTLLVDVFALLLLVLVISGWMLARKRRF